MDLARSELPGVVRVVVVDADDIVRQTVAALLGIGGGIEVVGMAGQPEAALEIVAAEEPDVVLVDPRLPDLDDGLAFIARIHALAPTARVLIVCSSEVLERAALTGAGDPCVRKTFRPDDLTAAVVAASRSMPA
jgi:DNA-binding NarL/FixJ family response regulator